MILVVDDEQHEIDSYILELRLSGFEVESEKGVDAALARYEQEAPAIELIILDIMMAPGAAFQDVDTQDGLRTGISLFEALRARNPHIPLLILTNVSDDRVAERFRREAECWFLRKEDYLPFELAEEVQRILAPRQTHEPQGEDQA